MTSTNPSLNQPISNLIAEPEDSKDTITFLHLTDVHFGQSHGWLWPTMRQQFYEDLTALSRRTGPWDVVLFSGDFVQKGTKLEFDAAKKELIDLWSVLKEIGPPPLLVCVPGNHDLERPSNTDPVTRQSLRWHDLTEKDVKKEFWTKKSSLYRKKIEKHFKNYSAWLKNLPIPQPKITRGLLPGDFCTILRKGNFDIGIIGLNTTFLQIGSENYDGKLDLHVLQLHALTDDQPDHWRKQVDFTLLMTHHPPSWLHRDARNQLSEIYASCKFDVHLSGHLHENALYDEGPTGGHVRRLRQGASLFGLLEYGISETRTAFGYTAGSWSLTGGKIHETLWPRSAVQTKAGHKRLGVDQTAEIDFDGAVKTNWNLVASKSIDSKIDKTNILQKTQSNTISESPPTNAEGKSLPEPTLQKRSPNLQNVPSAILHFEPQHDWIRTLQRDKFSQILDIHKQVWVIGDWGMGLSSFLACALKTFSSGKQIDTYLLQCGESITCEDIKDGAMTKFGMTFHEFCHFIGQDNAILIFEDLPSEFGSGPDRRKFESEVILPVKNYCPEMRMVFTSRKTPSYTNPQEVVTLENLSLEETRNYLYHHPRIKGQKFDPMAIEKMQSYAEGLPMKLDYIIEQLQYLSLPQIIGESSELSAREAMLMEAAPFTLRRSISELQNSCVYETQQSLSLLKLLTLLRDGEVLESIRKFYPTKPFSNENVKELVSHGLLNSVVISGTGGEFSRSKNGQITNTDSPRLLSVPAQVRQFVMTIITEEELKTILDASLESLFGKHWRNGSIQLRRQLNYSYASTFLIGPGNEIHVLRHLLRKANTNLIEGETIKIIKLGLAFCSRLINLDIYRDALDVSSLLVDFLRETGMNAEYAEAARLKAAASRMLDDNESTVTFGLIALEYGAISFSRAKISSIHLDIARAYENTDEPSALNAARAVLDYAQPKSSNAFEAKALVGRLTIDDVPKRKALFHQIMKDARINGHDTAANNIALSLASDRKDVSGSLNLVSDVIRSSKSHYTKTRAIIQKGILLRVDGKSSQLTREDRHLLFHAYDYAYTQRFSALFERSHDIIWDLFQSEGFFGSMLRLFRNSSFLWQLTGSLDAELKYLQRLSIIDLEEIRRTEGESFETEIAYVEARLKSFPQLPPPATR